MNNKQISKEDLVESFKGGSINDLDKYSDKQLHEQEDLLHLAVKYAPLSIIKYLLEVKKIPLFHSVDDDNDFAFNNIKNRNIKYKDSAEVYSLLLEKMHEKNPSWAIDDSPTKSLLDSVVNDNYITTNQKKDIIANLLEAKANINKNHKEGAPSTVLGRALWKKDDDLARFLIDAGANPDLPEFSIGKTSLAFDSTSTTINYVEQMRNPTPTDSKIAMDGLLKCIEKNNVSEIKRHLERPEFRRLLVEGKNLYETAKESIFSMTEEMHDLLKYNVAPKINKIIENSPTNNMLLMRENFYPKTEPEKTISTGLTSRGY